MHEIVHEIILATIVLTSQRFMHEHFITIPTLSCMNRTVSPGPQLSILGGSFKKYSPMVLTMSERYSKCLIVKI
jgi:hypothetical protein